MPCRDDPADYRTRNDYNEQVLRQVRRDFEAALCAVFRVLDTNDYPMSLGELLGYVDWQEAGVSRAWVEGWWASHKEQDRLRKLQEAARQRKEEARQSALAKLTPEEKQALGLK